MIDKTKQRIQDLEATNERYATEIARLEIRIGELSGEAARLAAELNQQRGVRRRAHDLYRAIDDSIIARIDRRGFARKKPRKTKVAAHIDPTVLSSKDRSALDAAAMNYDVKTYFRYHVSKSTMRWQYRVLSKAYRIARNASVFGIKKTYRVARRIV